MQAIAIVYAIVAWLACWLIDLIVVAARVPLGGSYSLLAEAPILKLVIVLLSLVIILVGLAKHRWLLSQSPN